MKLKHAVTALALTVALTAMPVFAASDTTLYLDRAVVGFETRPFLQDGITYVPLRAFCQTMGPCTIAWNPGASRVVVQAAGLEMTITAGRNYMIANERCFFMENPAVLQNDRLYIPLRLIAKAYDLDVSWDASKCSISLTSGDGSCAPASQVYRKEDLYWLARIINAESGHEPLLGKIAVGNVVLNRVANPQFPDTVYDVVFDRSCGVQFTPTANGAIYREPNNESMLAAKIALEGEQVFDTKCYYFLNESNSRNAWVQLNRPRVAILGHHSFFR